jgi:adenine-specific DNA-methyltransferase
MVIAETVYNSTLAFLSSVSKSERKQIGQFFTPLPIAKHMASLSCHSGKTVFILDPGAGSGILSAALINELVTRGVSEIVLDAYENNPDILPLLQSNLAQIQDEVARFGVSLFYGINDGNFITENRFAWTGLIPNEKYDIIISNPPYKKINKNDPESCTMSDIVFGQPNLYFFIHGYGHSTFTARRRVHLHCATQLFKRSLFHSLPQQVLVNHANN